MKKGIGPHGLGAAKSPAKMYDSPAKKEPRRNLAEVADRKRAKADKVEAKGKTKKAERLRNRASKLDEKHIRKAFQEAGLYNL